METGFTGCEHNCKIKEYKRNHMKAWGKLMIYYSCVSAQSMWTNKNAGRLPGDSGETAGRRTAESPWIYKGFNDDDHKPYELIGPITMMFGSLMELYESENRNKLQ